MGIFAEWRAARAQRRQAETYVTGRLAPPLADDVAWLTSLNRDRAIAVRELEFARRAVGLAVSERDALDDRTAALVAHALTAALRGGRTSASERDQGEWTHRWRTYSEALAARGSSEPPAVRMARVLLSSAGIDSPDHDMLERAAQIIRADRVAANEALRDVFGVASLPEDVAPSALRN